MAARVFDPIEGVGLDGGRRPIEVGSRYGKGRQPRRHVDQEVTLGDDVAETLEFNFKGVAEFGVIERDGRAALLEKGRGGLVAAVKGMDTVLAIHCEIRVFAPPRHEFKNGALEAGRGKGAWRVHLSYLFVAI